MKKIGIYKMQSIDEPDKFYIGSSINLQHRKSCHFSLLKNNKHYSTYLQNYVNKYGIDKIKFHIIEECNQEILLEREQYYIDSLTPCFNTRPIAESNYGHKFSDEVRLNMSNAQKKSKENKDFTVKLNKGLCDIVREFYNQGLKNREIANKLNLSEVSISKILNGKTKHSTKISNFSYKLDLSKASEIKTLSFLGYRLDDIAKKYNVTTSVISNINSNRIWKKAIINENLILNIDNLRTAYKLSKEQSIIIKEKLQNFKGNLKDLAKELNISYSKLIDIKRNKTFKN